MTSPTTPSLAPRGASTAHRPPPAGQAAGRGRRVTDAPMRLFHALFALGFAGAWLSGDSEHWRALHVTLGYTLAGLLGFRVLYGLVGPRPARLAGLWSRLRGAPAWIAARLRREPAPGGAARAGQNLAMAGVIAAILLVALPLLASGVAAFNGWGGEAMEEVHEAFGTLLLAIVALHVVLIAALSVLRRQNQALPMLTGRVDGSGPDLVRDNRAGLAALLLLAVVGFGTWQWQQSPAGLLPTVTAAHRGSHHEHDDD